MGQIVLVEPLLDPMGQPELRHLGRAVGEPVGQRQPVDRLAQEQLPHLDAHLRREVVA